MRGIRSAARSVAAAVLCATLIDLPLLGETPLGTRKASAPAKSAQLQGEQRVLHALNRMTFGPRPGEVEEVERVGLGRWFEQQLNPQRIDDAVLDARLAAYPAMFLPQEELLRRFPSPQMLRAAAQRGLPLPTDPVEHAIYADGIAFYKEAQARKAAGEARHGSEAQTPAAAPTTTSAAASMSAAPSMSVAAGMNDAPSMTPAADSEQAGPNRGRATHDEALFPEAEAADLIALPPEDRVRRILALQPDQMVRFRRSLSRSELIALGRDLTPQQKEIFAALQGSARMVGAEVLATRLERDVYSHRQVEAVLTDFWLNHFNVYLRKNQNEPFLLPAYERETIRPHALGRFEDLLVATAKSPAMLMYLDNWQSIGPDSIAATRGARFASFAKNPPMKQALKDRGLNENYARELMELHTLGVGCEVSKDHTAAELDPACGRGYTQADVTEVAKVFSGWTIDRPNQGGTYSFEERRHEPGNKVVLGHTIREGGEREGLEVLHMLAMSPATAKFLSTKLAVRFVGDTPPPALVDRMARSYLDSGSDICAVLRTMFDSPEFWSPEVYRDKVKTPLEFVVSALRATDADVANALPLVQALDRLGMPLYGMQTPNGYSWKSEPWVSTGALVSRMNFAVVLSGDRLPGTRTGASLLLGSGVRIAKPVSWSTGDAGGARSAEGSEGSENSENSEERRLEMILLGTPVSDRTRQAVLAQSGDSSVPRKAEHDFAGRGSGDADVRETAAAAGPVSPAERQERVMAGLLLGSPEFQRR